MIPRIARTLYRCRPPNRGARALVLVLASLVPFTASQDTQAISIPHSSSFAVTSGQTSYFSLGPTSDEQVYVTVSLCSPPDNLARASLPSHLDTVLYVSSTATLQQPGPGNVPSESAEQGATSKLEFGAANVTLFDGDASDGIWIGVTAPDDELYGGDGEGTWTFELDVTNDAPLVLLDGGAGFDFLDSSQSEALLATANWTDGQPQPSDYVPAYWSIVAPTTPLSHALGRSRCFVQSQSAIPQRDIITSTTTRGYGDGNWTQFAVSNLPRGANYTAWLVQNLTEISNSTNATRLWDPVSFTTKSTSSCRLLYDLDFCPKVAYSVPAPLSLATTDLVDYFNDTISPSLAAFARTLTTFPCNSTRFGQYSVVATCADCYAAYRDWVCATTIPRCTDAPPNVTSLVPSNASSFEPASGLATWSIPQQYSDALVRDFPPASRTPAFAPLNLSSTFPRLFNSSYPANRDNTFEQSPFPYSEVPPCMDVCHLVDARCPAFLKWGCPTSGDTGRAAYGMTEPVGGHERVAGDVRHSSRTERAQDRWGNVFCNALGSDLAMAAQFVTSSSTAPPTLSVVPVVSLIVFVSGFLLH
ncbi:hypothetical protein JCM3766R1_005750 [Sporobolomyces carnicolor]